MRFLVIMVCSLALMVMGVAGDELTTTVTVTELPPEAIPVGTCTESRSGYLGTEKNGRENTKLSDKQIGEYVRKRLNEGYSVSLYPQSSGRIFSIATCPSRKH